MIGSGTVLVFKPDLVIIEILQRGIDSAVVVVVVVVVVVGD